jgi:hypothetical protein
MLETADISRFLGEGESSILRLRLKEIFERPLVQAATSGQIRYVVPGFSSLVQAIVLKWANAPALLGHIQM